VSTLGSGAEYETDWHEEMRKNFKSRFAFEQPYWSFASFKILSACCCCLRKRWLEEEHGWLWFKRQKVQIEKVTIAQQKFDSEVDLKNIITALRVGKFLSKIQTKKRQRRSVGYFRRYTIDEKTVQQALAAERRKEIEEKTDPKELAARQ